MDYEYDDEYEYEYDSEIEESDEEMWERHSRIAERGEEVV